MSKIHFCGLDIGVSTTDAVGDWAIERPVTLPTVAPEPTGTEAVRRLLVETPPPDGARVVLAATGYGAHHLSGRLCGLEMRKVPEITAIGRGGVQAAALDEGLVVSLGTGTAMVSVRGGEIVHLAPGSGVGGGTLLGFARTLCGVGDLDAFSALARRGDRARVDLTIGDLIGGPLGALPSTTTASNLGKGDAGVAREDLAAALVNLVTEVVLSIALYGLRVSGHAQMILTGKLMRFEPIGERIAELTSTFGSLVVIPERAGIATALGALWSIAHEEPE